MEREGRIEGRVNLDWDELVQFGKVKQRILIADAHADEKLKAAILRNKWEPLP